MKQKLNLHISEKIATWLGQYEGKEKSVIDLYLDYIADTPPDDNFNIRGNNIKVWRDDFFGLIYIEITDWLSLKIDDADAWISKQFSKITPYRYVKVDNENKVITFCAIIGVNDEKYTREIFKKIREDSDNFLDSFEIVLEDDDEEAGGVNDV